MYGPVSVRRSDLYTLERSDLYERMSAICRERHYNIPYCLYGDSIYPINNHIIRKHEDVVIDDNEQRRLERQAENDAMAAGRITIEWINADIKTKFAFIDYKKCLRIRNSHCKETIFTAIFLTNCWKCLNGCNTSQYFDEQPPTLENYLAGRM
jgi:hypothetical protein